MNNTKSVNSLMTNWLELADWRAPLHVTSLSSQTYSRVVEDGQIQTCSWYGRCPSSFDGSASEDDDGSLFNSLCEQQNDEKLVDTLVDLVGEQPKVKNCERHFYCHKCPDVCELCDDLEL